ncbi:minor extracellular serine protease [Bacillus sp. NRRL B-14911]|uniref:Peptidase S8 n=1 Tax=Bacillus infantis NRRL B-14911 TaxID=1367477 RepID=U5LIR1_9BACI|nr:MULTISPECIES: S8 family serine peptidase [Bacillus]AGX06586.1 peptidase S8 [Bacillus infantis NRRL B-14911]EAR68474.1 minor extracellular serine protease [Bacillus sp. NRRL B-14911]
MKKIFLIISLFALMLSPHVNARTLQIPPLPAEPEDAERVAIVLMKEGQTEQDRNILLRQYPDLILRQSFQEALNGFSVKGPVKSLDRLAKEEEVQTISQAVSYQAESEDGISLIGSHTVRGLFDEKGERLSGKGVTIGVIDTGIDYNHPDLRRNYAGGRDLVDQDDDPMETVRTAGEDTFHGTHVAGVIAANGKMRGVAPDAKIIAYRALGPGGAGTTEQVIAAIEQAIKDKVDILNLSLGNSVNGPDLPISLALNKAVDKGITAVTSSGNSGPNTWTVGSPGTASKAISVGASTPMLQIPYLDFGSGKKVKLNPLQGSSLWNLDRSYELALGGLGNPEELKRIKGKIALIQRGGLTFSQKAKNARQAGAIAVIIYNNTDGSFAGNLEEDAGLPVVSLSKQDGDQLKKRLQEETVLARTYIIEEKDILADFSSRGPVTDTWEIKPDVLAPGVAISSTVPGGYLPLQGTSMASPHVAGACALIKQAHPDWSPEEIKASLMNTALPLYNEEGMLYRTYEQGAGRIQVEDAVKAPALVTPASLQFGKFKIAGRENEHVRYLTVKNTGSRTESYSFTVPANISGIEWEMPLAFRLEPGGKKKVAIKMRIDPEEFKQKIHDGRLVLNAGGRKVGIPYLYVLEEPDYPRVMGFDFGRGDNGGSYRYEVYLPGGAEEFGIALFDPDTLRFVQFLDWKRGAGKGQIRKELANDDLPPDGVYIAQVFARKAGRQDMIEAYLEVRKEEEEGAIGAR